MKTETFVIVTAILILIGIAGMGAMKTRIGQQQQEIAEAQAEIDRLEAWRYWTQIAALPPSYHQPLDQLWVSSGVGYRMDPMGGATESLHKGHDYAAPIGTPVYAALSGLVKEHFLVPGIHNGKMYYGDPIFGAKIVIEHQPGLLIVYGHFSETEVHEGDWVEMGQKIGEVGNTGISTGPHLHFEIVVDPMRYLEGL